MEGRKTLILYLAKTPFMDAFQGKAFIRKEVIMVGIKSDRPQIE